MLKIGLLASIIIISFDQVTKWLIRDFVLISAQRLEVTKFFNIVEVWNQGVSFGLLASDSPWTPYLLSTLALAIVTILVLWLRKVESRFLAVALGIVIGGAVGNVIDRLIWGRVFDFLDFHVAGYHWPAFNVADSVICIGAVLILIDGFVAKRHEQS